MASSRKKQDEQHLKTLRELGALAQNKYCFDCGQRGPTYVNVTIGSFVCTKCSGMLRGITPPHRVKSISMATFTADEIELVRARGNEYCRRVWLGLYESSGRQAAVNPADEQSVRDHMVDKYERRRFYLDHQPGQQQVDAPSTKPDRPKQPAAAAVVLEAPKTALVRNNGVYGNHHRTRTIVQNAKNNNNGPSMDFVADFDKADIFSANNNQQQQHQMNGFANFDNNPVFSQNGTSNNIQPAPSNGTNGHTNNINGAAGDSFSIFDLQFTHSGPVLNQVPLFPKCSPNISGPNQNFCLLTPANMNNINGWTNGHHQQPQQQQQAPAEDKYAALKDLDNALKSQSAVDWGSTGSNGSLYSSPTPTGSMYSSSSPQSSIFGSPSQSNFMSAFVPAQENGTAPVSNPFNGANGGMNWPTNNGSAQQTYANPFRDTSAKLNGFSQGFQPFGAGNQWTPNPFKIGATAGGAPSNNPFL